MKAIALISGGLDSLLAAKLIQEQGIEVIALYFYISFCSRAQSGSYGCPDAVRKTADCLGVEARVVNIADEFLEVLAHPRHGYGAHINPCIDCKILMLRKSVEFMRQSSAQFVVTGEVLGQRPMSQHKKALMAIERESGLEGLIVRPLSAKLLEMSTPEKEGWIDRNRLLAFNGRGRRPQMELAKAFSINDYTNPAGGCLLTDPLFAKRVKDLISHKALNADDVELLKVGRHFRLSEDSKLVVGRDAQENELLLGLARQGDYIFIPPDDIAGATALGRGVFNHALLSQSCSILCRYCDFAGSVAAQIHYRRFPEPKEEIVEASVSSDAQLAALRI